MPEELTKNSLVPNLLSGIKMTRTQTVKQTRAVIGTSLKFNKKLEVWLVCFSIIERRSSNVRRLKKSTRVSSRKRKVRAKLNG